MSEPDPLETLPQVCSKCFTLAEAALGNLPAYQLPALPGPPCAACGAEFYEHGRVVTRITAGRIRGVAA